jgi:hypothetical protein
MNFHNEPSGSLTWAAIEVGQELELLDGNRREFAGRVDAVTNEHDIFWLTSATGERRLFHAADGYTAALVA